MNIVVVGTGVIGSIYGARLAGSGHDVTLLAQGLRPSDLGAHGLVLEDVDSGQVTEVSLRVRSELYRDDRFDLALVPVRSDQLASTLPILRDMSARSNVLLFGNTVGHQGKLVAKLGKRALFGFPADCKRCLAMPAFPQNSAPTSAAGW